MKITHRGLLCALVMGLSASPLRAGCFDRALSAFGKFASHSAEVDYYDYQKFIRPMHGMDQIQKSNSLLLLSDVPDAQSVRGSAGLAEQYLRLYPEKAGKIVKGDILLQGDSVEGGIRAMHLDNCRPLPFASDKFQTIVLRKGVCFCSRETNSTCGGVPRNVEAAARIVGEWARVLDKEAPHSLGVFHGWRPTDNALLKETKAFWKQVFAEVERAYPQVQLRLMVEHGRDLHGFIMTVRSRPRN